VLIPTVRPGHRLARICLSAVVVDQTGRKRATDGCWPRYGVAPGSQARRRQLQRQSGVSADDPTNSPNRTPSQVTREGGERIAGPSAKDPCRVTFQVKRTFSLFQASFMIQRINNGQWSLIEGIVIVSV